MDLNHNISEEELDEVERYISKNMTSEELAAFTTRLSTDVELQSKVQEVRLLLLGVQQATLETKLNGFHEDLPAKVIEHNHGKTPSLSRWLAAAAILALVAVGAWLFFGNKEENLYSKFYKPDPGLISAMSTSDNYTFDRAMIDYKTGNYDSAIKAWEGLLASNPANDTLNYFIGSAWLAKGETRNAITHLQKVTTVTNSYFIDDAHWYLGLALLKEGKKNEAIPNIEKSKHEQRNALLLKLKE